MWLIDLLQQDWYESGNARFRVSTNQWARYRREDPLETRIPMPTFLHTRGRILTAFFLAAILPPTLLRLSALLFRLPPDGPLSPVSGRIAGLLLGMTQDLFVALEVLVLGLCAKWLFRRSTLAFAALCAGILVPLLSYVVFDFFLFWKVGIRMNLQFLEYVRMVGSFQSSIQAVDPRPLWLGLILVGLFTLAVFVFFSRRELAVKPGLKTFMLMGALAALAPAATALAPAGIAYYASNPVFSDQRTLLLYGPGGTRERGQWPDAGDAAPPMETFSRAEAFRRVDPEYPLLKNTTGFKGEKRFHVSIQPQERPHVVFLFLESFRAADIGALGGRYPVSPHFDRLSDRGILFRRFYATGTQTTRGLISSLFGILPRFSSRSAQSGEPDMPLIGLSELFKRRNYHTAFIHNGSLEFDAQDRFSKSHAYDEVFGEDQIRGASPSAHGTSWGLYDEYLMPYVVDHILKKQNAGVPAFVTVITMTNHHPYTVPADYVPPRIDGCEDEEYRRFLKSFSYTDRCLGLFWDLLREKGLDERTVVFVLADTAQPMGEHHKNHMLINHLYEENLAIPLLILAEGRISRPVTVDDIGSQVDLLPTVMDMFQMKGLNHAVGTSLMRRVRDRTVYFNNPFTVGYWGLRTGRYKYVYAVDSGRAHLYDLTADPTEDRNLAPSMPELSKEFHTRIVGTYRLFERLYRLKRFARPSSP